MTVLASVGTFRPVMATKASKTETASRGTTGSKTAAPKTVGSRSAPPGAPQRPTLSFSRVNAMWLGAGVISIAIGYFLLSTGSETIAPILLVLGYCVLLPIGIIKK